MSWFSFAQIKFDVKVSDKHLQKVERSKDAREKLKSYKKYYKKDSIKQAKEEWEIYRKQHKDSLKRERSWKEAKANRKKILKNEWEPYQDRYKLYHPDSLDLPEPKDSLDSALRELAQQGEWQRVQQLYEQYAHYDSAYLEQFKTDTATVVDELKQQGLDSAELASRFQVKERVARYLPEELQQETDTNIAKQLKNGTIDELGDIQQLDKSGVKDFFKNVKPEEFARSQLSLKSAKEKYAKVPNLEKPEEGVKKQSLEETPWKKRIFLGGNFTIQSTDPFIVDMDVRGGYRFNKWWSAGVGFIYREQFNDRDSTSTLTGDAYGYSFFTTYEVLKQYFVTAEYQALKDASLFSGTDGPATWQYAYLAGVGRTIRFSGKVSASFSLLYDFNFKKNDLNARPVVFRFGYKVSF